MKTASLKHIRLLAGLSSALFATGPWAAAEDLAELRLHTYAGLTITGEVGKVYSVEYVTQLNQQEDWKCLEFVELLESPYLWMDGSAPARERRFYRAVQMDAPTNMVWIPPGTFRMGSTNVVGDGRKLEGPQTEVVVLRGFWMSKNEVTQGEWNALMSYSLPNSNSGHPTLPVDYASGFNAIAFCAAITAQQQEAGKIPHGCSYRLPTEIEWEYACRAETSTRFSFGEDPDYTDLANYAWYEGNSEGRSHPVGLKSANAWGLFDMHGNVAEWCYHVWADEGTDMSIYPGGRVIAPDSLPVVLTTQGGQGGRRWWEARLRPRGGAWFDTADLCRAAARDVERDGGFGFRMVLAPVVFRPQPNMVYISPGTFLMGSPDSEEGREDNEGPQTQVTLTQEFWMGKYEVTQGEFELIMGHNPSSFTGDPNRPVESVSWLDAVAFCDALTQREKAAGRIPNDYSYRLPTEAEWEYACRAGSTTRFSYGDDPDYVALTEYAWFGGNSGGLTYLVGQKRPNNWGLFDMHGNVLEWCHDLLSASLPGGSVVDPQGPDEAAVVPGLHAYRGGAAVFVQSFPREHPQDCRSASRGGVHTLPPGLSASNLGFRIVLSRVRP